MLQLFNYVSTERRSDSRCHNNKSRLTTFRLEASHANVMKEAYQSLDSLKGRGDIEWIDSSRDNGIPSANTRQG